MKQLKNLSLIKNKKEKISLVDFVLFCINESIKISKNRGGNLWDVDRKISEIYGFTLETAIRMYFPVFDYLSCDINTRIIEADSRVGVSQWYAKEKALNLSEEEKKKIAKKIIQESKEYYKAIINKFNLDILIR